MDKALAVSLLGIDEETLAPLANWSGDSVSKSASGLGLVGTGGVGALSGTIRDPPQPFVRSRVLEVWRASHSGRQSVAYGLHH